MNIAVKDRTTASESWHSLKAKLTQSQPDLTDSSLQIICELYMENVSSLGEENKKLKAQLQLTPSDKRDTTKESTCKRNRDKK